jgi:predicted transcriptional regulator
MIVSDVRKAIRSTRKKSGLTQAELVKRAHLSSVARFASFEAGYGKLKGEEIDRVIKILNRAEKKRMVPLSNLSYLVPPPEARKAYRIEAGLTQHELARRADLSQDLISKFELGKKELTPQQAARWGSAIEAATKQPSVEEIVDLATSALCSIPVVNSAEFAQLRERAANLTEQVENLKRQLRNSEVLCAHQEEVSALQHYQIEELKERFGEEASEVLNHLN